LFEENGFKTPKEYYEEGKWTWDNLLKCAKDIKALGADYKGIMLESDILIGSLGTSFIKYDYKTNPFSSGINDKALLEGFQWYAEAREQGLLDGSFATFQANKCGLVIRGPYGLKTTGYFMDMNPEDVGFTYLPAMEEGGDFYIDGIYRMYGICDKAPNADAAGYFIRYWLDPDCYDLENTFLTNAAGNFYYELTNTEATDKYFNYETACMTLIGKDIKEIWTPVRNASSAGVKTAIDSVSNIVDQAVAKANEIVQAKLAADRLKYN
jgi:ABC-type glycerol-3-phosphate transport system substrate-binding protein